MSVAIIGNLELRGILAKNGLEPYNLVILDKQYALPSREWFRNSFRTALAHNINALGLSQYAFERWDCDDFAMLAMVLAKINHRLNGAKVDAGLAVGVVCYMSDKLNGRHAILMAVTDNYEVSFIEPNGCIPVALNDNEKASATDIVI